MKRIVALITLAALAIGCGDNQIAQPTPKMGASLIYPGGGPFTGQTLRTSAGLLNPALAAQGLVAQTYDRTINVNSTASGAVSGTLQGVLVNLYAGTTITNLHLVVGTLPTGLTLAKLAVFTTTGTLLGATADMSAAMATQGLKSAALTAPYVVTVSGAYYFALLQVAGTTPAGCNHGAGNIFGNEAVGAGKIPMPVQTGLSDIPSPATFVAPTGTAPSIGRGLWIGAS